MVPGIDNGLLRRLLSEIVGAAAHITSTAPLGESSRETPWRIDVETASTTASFVFRHGEGCSRNEAIALHAMAGHPIPTPRLLHWDESGETFGTPIFISEFIEGDPLLPAMKAGEAWAIDRYLDTACALQDIRAEDLPSGAAALFEGGETINEVIEAAYERFAEPTGLHTRAYRRLIDTQPGIVDTAFSNGDLWPENLIVRGRELAGVIDWQHAGWTDPLFEFLLPFFLVPEVRGLGIEELFCERKGYDPAILDWYHGVEFFDSLAWVLRTGEPYEMHTADTLTADLEGWLSRP